MGTRCRLAGAARVPLSPPSSLEKLIVGVLDGERLSVGAGVSEGVCVGVPVCDGEFEWLREGDSEGGGGDSDGVGESDLRVFAKGPFDAAPAACEGDGVLDACRRLPKRSGVSLTTDLVGVRDGVGDSERGDDVGDGVRDFVRVAERDFVDENDGEGDTDAEGVDVVEMVGVRVGVAVCETPLHAPYAIWQPSLGSQNPAVAPQTPYLEQHLPVGQRALAALPHSPFVDTG